MRSPQEWLAHPQGEATVKRPMIDIGRKGSTGNGRLGQAKNRPLEGVRVVELAMLVAGPTIGRLLAEQGADVIKVQPPVGDWLLPLWLDVNWGKKSILLDIKGRSGKARLVELLASADVFVNSNGPGVLDRLGLDENLLRQVNPNLVFVGVSYAAQSTPWQARKGFEQIAQAVTGVTHASSERLSEPTVISVLINDYLTGYLGAIGALAALAEREEKGGYWNVGASLPQVSLNLATPRNTPRSPFRTWSITELIRTVPWGLSHASLPQLNSVIRHRWQCFRQACRASIRIRPDGQIQPIVIRHTIRRIGVRNWRAKAAFAILSRVMASKIAATVAAASVSRLNNYLNM